MELACQSDPRRDAVRAAAGRNGLDYVEVGDDQRTLHVYFLGKLPPELAVDSPALNEHLVLEGGDVITGIRILDADPVVDPDPERDDFLVVRLDRSGDFSPYTLRLVGVKGIDPHYASVSFSFKVCCPSDVDCKAPCDCEPATVDEPRLNYLAKDYASFRQLIFDRMALLVPDWTERHVPDLGVTLVDLLAYVGDQLSYYQDAVATEAYLESARQRISVRRHARLVDYRLHEGCNARAWLFVGVSSDPPPLKASQLAFITAISDEPDAKGRVLSVEQLENVPRSACEWFEPLVANPDQPLKLRAAHNRITFYTWGRRECCLPKGATRATLLDHWLSLQSEPSLPFPTSNAQTAKARTTKTNPKAVRESAAGETVRALDLQVGDVLIFEEVLGAHTGVEADADPSRRWAVRLTNVKKAEDPLYPIDVGDGDAHHTRPTPVVEIEWGIDDALPFALCVSAIGAAPECAYLADISVARGNVVLVDHGRTLPEEPLGPVPGVIDGSCCDCEGQPSPVQQRPARFRPRLGASPVTHSQSLPAARTPASRMFAQDPRAALAALGLSKPGGAISWHVCTDLLASGPDDRDFVCEIDNERIAHLRFGDGELGRRPDVGSMLTARYRVGVGKAGNVGAEAISCVVLKDQKLDGIEFTIRNPMPAQGGIEPEPMAEAQLFAPAAFRKQIARAITSDDYAALAALDKRLQRAHAQFAWTGSWYEADVSVDPLGREFAASALLHDISGTLHRYRRMGHDLCVQRAVYVPLCLKLEVCALPGYDRGHVKSALLARLGTRAGSGGVLGFFHPDRLSFGDGIYLSQIVAAAMAVPGVECMTVVEFHRSFESPNHEIENGVLPLASHEIAQLDNDPNHPERGQLDIDVRGGR